MRYERVEDILKLALLMQASYKGLSLNDIHEHFEVSRRTAERMRDAVMRLFPQIDEVETNSKIKRWTLRNHSLAPMVSFTPEELAELENTKKKLKVDGLKNKAETIEEIIAKVKVLNKNEMSKIEPDLEALLEAEGYAIRQYPRFKIDKEVLSQIREALKAFKILEIKYEKANKELQKCQVHPYGFIYGEKHFLVAYNPERHGIRLYNLSKIKNIKTIDEYFERDENFNLSDYSQNSFGVYQEDPFNVVLQFDKSVAEDVKNFHFHPTQKIKEQKDGSVRVDFTAGGSLAMCWHLFKWGKLVKIIKPAGLKKMYKTLLKEAEEGLTIK
ncbi:MAG: WYL domain-containing protein [Candidatus Gastranaerophilales bacterium]|nr:WYL domain-containing protein [Candidatus Gastranaerophilales bacterium]